MGNISRYIEAYQRIMVSIGNGGYSYAQRQQMLDRINQQAVEWGLSADDLCTMDDVRRDIQIYKYDSRC